MEKLGVIGGMGAEATSYYYDQVVRHTAAACDQEHIDMVVLSKSTMPDRTLAIKTGEHAKLLATMKECAQALESLGCAHIAIPCNTSHYFYDQIQSFTKVPIIHMPRESVRYALAGAVMGECEFDPNPSIRSASWAPTVPWARASTAANVRLRVLRSSIPARNVRTM